MSHEPVRYADTLIFPASLDPDAVTVVRRLNEAGLQSYFVGGCVRDLLLGLIPKDFDVSTEARPRQIRRLFRNSRIIGRRFKLAHIRFGDKVIEVATFRRTPEGSGDAVAGTATEVAGETGADVDFGPGAELDAGPEPGRDADEGGHEGDDDTGAPRAAAPPGPGRDLLITQDNEFGTAEEDALRRDFTINALLYDVRTSEVIDYVGGVPDLRARRLRTIGDPWIRFAEDPVRMLRAVKFCSRLDLQLEPGGEAALRASADRIRQSAPPRVLEEIFKLLTCGRAERALPQLEEYGLLERLLPEIASWWADHREQLAATGRALDVIDRGRRRRSNAFLLAALWLAPWRDRVSLAPGSDPLQHADAMLETASRRMNIPRRDVSILRQQLLTQLRFEHPRRSRRFRLSDFLARPGTAEAIDLLHLAALSGLVDPDLHARWAWRQATLGAGSADAEDDEQAEHGEAPSRPVRAGGGARAAVDEGRRCHGVTAAARLADVAAAQGGGCGSERRPGGGGARAEPGVRQRPGAARAAVRREVLLRPGPQDAARGARAATRQRRLSQQARQPARARRAHP